MAHPDRDYASVEIEFKDAEKALRKLIGDRGRPGPREGEPGDKEEAARHIEAMSRAFSWHAAENRRMYSQIGHLESELHGVDHQAEVAMAKLRRAANARAAIAAEAMATLKGLLPEAKAQAKKGKPALLKNDSAGFTLTKEAFTMKPKTRCEWCGKKGAHVLDNRAYCCKHFDDVVEHGGNIRILEPEPLRAEISPEIAARIGENAQALRQRAAVAMRVHRREKRAW